MTIEIGGTPGQYVLTVHLEGCPQLQAAFPDWDTGPWGAVKGWVNNPALDFGIDDAMAISFMCGKANLDQVLGSNV